MLLDQSLNPPNLSGSEAAAALKAHGAQPELRRILVAFDVNMPRLIPIARVEEETVGARSQHRRHRPTLPEVLSGMKSRGPVLGRTQSVRNSQNGATLQARSGELGAAPPCSAALSLDREHLPVMGPPGPPRYPDRGYPPRLPRYPPGSRSQVEQPVGRAADAAGPTVQNVRVDLGRGEGAVAEELLHGTDVVVGLEEVGGEGVAERVAGRALGDARPARRLLHRPLEHGLVQVVPAPLAGDAVEVDAGGGEHPLPRPLASRVRVLAGERPGKLNPARAMLEVALMLPLDA